MSFVFAEKYKVSWSETERLDIHCDTRIVKESISGAHFSAKQRSFIEQYGIVKSTIIAPEICNRLLEMIFYMPPNCSASYMTDTHFRGKT